MRVRLHSANVLWTSCTQIVQHAVRVEYCLRMERYRRAAAVLPGVAMGILFWSTPAVLAYRDLERCPDLTPLEPPVVVSSRARRCGRALANASRRGMDRVLSAHAACFERVQTGELTGDANERCRGLVRLSTGAFDPPTDSATAAVIAAAEAGLEEKIVAECSDADAAALGSCGPSAAELARCVLAEQREHALHTLDQLVTV